MTEPRRNAPDSPSVAVEPGAHTTAGGMATLRLHARNLAADARDLSVSVVGLEESWRPPVTVVPGVAPDETVTLEVVLTPAPGAAPGDYPFLVVLESGSGPTAARTVADAMIRVDGASDVVLSIEPAEVRGIRRKRVDVVVGNSGLSPAEVTLDARSDQQLAVDLSEASVLLGPAETVRIPATVRARVRLAGSRQRYSYEVVATGRAAPRRVQGTFASRAVLGSAAIRVTAVVAVMALWITAVVIALPQISDHFTQDDATPTAADAPSGSGTADPGATDGADGTDSPAGSGGEDGGGEEGAGEDGAGEDGGGDQPEGVRVAGTVSGVEPGGVVVDVMPTSSLWATGLAPETGTSRLSASPGKIAAAHMPMAPVGSTQRLTTRTNDNGVWALSGLSASARYLVTISKAGFATQRVVMTGAELAAAPLETTMEAGEGSMSGVVMGPGGPVGGVEITLTDGTTTVTTRTATTGAVGRWHVDGLVTPSTYLVTAAAADLGTQAELVPLTAAGSREVDLTLDAGVAAISGQVVGVDSLGSIGGLGGITVTATDGTTTRTATTVTGDGAGRFLLPRLPVPASYTVTISGPGYSTVTRAVTVTSSGISDWTISLTSSGGAVTGTVTDDTGAGITAAGLVLTHGSNTTAIYKTMSASDGSGTFRFAGVAPGTYVLSAESFGHETTYAEVIVRAGGVVEVDLELRRIPRDGLVATASIVGRAFDASTSGQITCPILAEGQECLITATVTAEDIDGTSRTLSATAVPGEPYRLPATGSGVDGLLPGRYVVTVTAPGYEPGEVTVTVAMGAEAEAAPVALEPSPSLTGSILPRTGVLPDGVCVVARAHGTAPIEDPCDTESPECSTATTRCVVVEDSTYTMDRLSAGGYTVTVEGLSNGYVSPPPQSVHLLPGEVRRYDVVLERNGILSVTALTTDGRGSVDAAESGWIRLEVDGVPTGDETDIDSEGFAQLIDIEPGTYDVVGSTEQGGPALARSRVTIGLNQEITVQLVLAAAVSGVTAQVRYQTSPGSDLPVPGAEVTITGVVGYTGTRPDIESATFTTHNEANQPGSVMICTAAGPLCTDWLGLVENRVDVLVDIPGFDVFSRTGVQLETLSTIMLLPQARTFTGNVSTVPGLASYESIRFEVVEAPPGVVQPSAQSDAAGNVTFTDRSLPSGQIRPGHYTLTARLDGYASETVTFEVPLAGSPTPMPQPQWQLLRYARVGVAAVVEGAEPGTTTRVPGAVITLTGPDDLRLERTAGPSQTVLDFGTLPPGDQYTLEINIAGYRQVSVSNVSIEAGATLAEPVEIEVERLGTIAGNVVTVLGEGWTQALPGATVTAESEESPVDFAVTSTDTGRFRIAGTLEKQGLDPVLWDLTASAAEHESVTAPGGVESSVSVDLELGEAVDDLLLGLAPEPATLQVTVMDQDDAIDGLELQLVYSNAGRLVVRDPCPEGSGGACQTRDGTYHFTDLLPLSYTLFISGRGYMPLSTPVSVAAGSNPTLQVPITAPTGSIQGEVLQTLYDGTTEPLTGDDDDTRVLLLQNTTEVGTALIDDLGGYVLEGVAAGTYTVLAQAADGDDWSTLVSKTVSVLSGQSTVVDLVIPLVSRPVRVDVTSTNGTDLAGALVTLVGTVDDDSLTLGPQPLGRTASGYSATFTQVPPGTWVASVSGPAGHHGSHLGPEVTVTQTSPATVTTAVSVAETELRLQIAPETSPLDPPDQVQVTATPSATPPDDISVAAVTTTLIPGSSDSVLYVPAIGWSLTVADPGEPWGATISPTTVAADAARVLARVTLTAADVATTTTISAPAEVTVADDIEVTATVSPSTAGDPAPTAGTVHLQYRLGNSGAWTTVSGSVEISEGGTAALSVGTTGWEPGAYAVRATFDAPQGWADSTSAASPVTVSAADDGGAGTDGGGEGTDGAGTDGAGAEGGGEGADGAGPDPVDVDPGG